MKLVEVHVQKFRNFDDSEVVTIEDDVTALVGKNESGKTAFLQALCRLNPAHGETFDELDQYPRWLYTKDRKSGAIGDAVPITAVFELEEDDVKALAERFGEGVVTATRLTATRVYDDSQTIDQDSPPDEAKAVALVLGEADVPEEYRENLESNTTFQALRAALAKLEQPPAEGEGVAPEAANRSTVRDIGIVFVHRVP